MSMEIGDNLRHYRIVDKIGEGGMGEVHHVHIPSREAES